MKRLLVVGAGASVEECRRSGARASERDWWLPVIGNFGHRLFDPTSAVLLKVTAAYLDAHGIPFDSKLLNVQPGDLFTREDIRRGPVGAFLNLEATSPEAHNVERLCEFAWQQIGDDRQRWGGFVHDAIYLKLFVLFTEQFGLGVGRPMLAGQQVARLLTADDVVLNLNYDICFDLALKQVGHSVCYAPEAAPSAVKILKPHGSMNFYVNVENGNCFFEQPDTIAGSVGIPDPAGGVYFVQHGIIPPRLNKTYEQHPCAATILDAARPFVPKEMTFWGVGLTDSDVDLLAIYREAATAATRIDFISPCAAAHQKAIRLLEKDIIHFATLDEWLSKRQDER